MAFKGLPTRSRRFFFDIDRTEVNFTFGSDYISQDDISVYLNNEELIRDSVNGYQWVSATVIRLQGVAADHPAESALEMVRVTPTPPVTMPSTDPSPTQLLYMIQEAFDAGAFCNGHGPSLRTDINGSSLFENKVSGVAFPVVQLLPDGGLVAYPDGENPGGFKQAAFRHEHRVSAEIPPQSMSLGWMSYVIEESTGGFRLTKNSSYYGLKLTCKSYQSGDDTGDKPYHLENGALNAVAVTAAGVTFGTAQGIIVEARHEAVQASCTFETTDSTLKLTARGGETTRGALGNMLRARIMAPAGTPSVVVGGGGYNITITPKIGEDSALEVADLINDPTSAAQELVLAEGSGEGAVEETGFVDLDGGLDTNGKLVGVQNVVRPHGVDTGSGYVTASGALTFNSDTAYPSYGYTGNSNGFYPGFSAYSAKSRAEPGDPFEQGWYNGFCADDKSIQSRLMWLYKYFAIEVPDCKISDPDPRTHDSLWMGIGTDRPKSPLHLTVWGSDKAEARLENTAENPVAGDFAGIALDGRGANGAAEEAEVVTMASITGYIANPDDAAKDVELVFRVMHNNGYAARWRMSTGLWSEGVAGGNRGPGSVNAKSFHVNGTNTLFKEPTGGGGTKVVLGEAATRQVDATGAIAYKAAHMIVTAAAPGADLTSISGGVEGAELVLRSTDASGDVMVKDSGSGNIRCGGDVPLANARSTLTLIFSGGQWLRTGGFVHA